METIFQPELKAHLTLDDDERVRHIVHTEYFAAEAGTPRAAAREYLGEVAETLAIAPPQLDHLNQQVSYLDPHEHPIEYRLADTKKFFDSSTLAYYQTIHNTPVWDGGLTVSVKDAPLRIVGADHRGHPDLKVDLPPQDVIDRVKAQLIKINSGIVDDRNQPPIEDRRVPARGMAFNEAFGTAAPKKSGRRAAADFAWFGDTRITRGRFFIYRYIAEDRQPGGGKVFIRDPKDEPLDLEAGGEAITLPLPPVPDQIREGVHYLVVEIVFNAGRTAKESLNWKALVEVETGAILWLRALISGINGYVFTYDPKTSTGVLTNTPDDGNATLNPLRDDVTLQNLDAPVVNVQSLKGSNVTIVDDNSPTVAAPTMPTGMDFDFDARTNHFGAVNAYYHADALFEMIEDLGFSLASYFDGTSFPVHVDHRASSSNMSGATGIEVNAFCSGDAQSDGIGLVGFCLSDVSDTGNPLGRSVDKWVHWHEVGGHGILWDHVDGPNFGFAHSAGDALAAFQNDPESLLRALPERFQYAPFRDWPAGSERFFNRTIASGWGWGGSQDPGAGSGGLTSGYRAEQIVATTLFRMYQSIGGDAAEVAKRWHASRVATYLVLNAVGKLAPGANANSPTDLFNKLVLADADDWTSEGLAGGAYKKLIRWAFERQGLFQAPGAPVPTTQVGAPPAVDLYIDDGRAGEYQYLANHWSNQSVWNRTIADGMAGSQPGVEGVESFAYVKVKNRGTVAASGTVKVYHSLPGAGLTWPTEFVQAGPVAGLPTGNVQANNGNEVIVGPFAWTPNANAYGHDCLIAIVETAQDPSNVNNFGPGETIQEWRLVPHDNNVGQRNVPLVPGGGGMEALVDGLDGAFFMAGNNFNKAADMELKVALPEVLASRGWRLEFAGLRTNKFRLKAGEKRRVELQLTAGADFSADDVRGASDRTISVELYGAGMLLGGMSYYVDPDLKKAPGRGGRPDSKCNHVAGDLLESSISGEVGGSRTYASGRSRSTSSSTRTATARARGAGRGARGAGAGPGAPCASRSRKRPVMRPWGLFRAAGSQVRRTRVRLGAPGAHVQRREHPGRRLGASHAQRVAARPSPCIWRTQST